jgi:hypothetical protein
MKFKKDNNFDIGNMGDYLPMNSSDGLLHFPENTITNMANNSKMMPHDYMLVSFLLALLYLFVFFIWSKNRVIKTDL